MAFSRPVLVTRGQRLQYLTIAYNSLEALLAIGAGILAGSIALVGFGVDSVIEVTAGVVALWRLRADHDRSRRVRVDLLSLRLIGGCFVALALYVGYDAITALLAHKAPSESLVGILLAIGSLITMPLLARAKRKVALGMGSNAMTADAKQTELCTYLSAILLGGLLLNALVGWYWADPVAALIMVPIIAKEGVDGIRGKACCTTACQCTNECRC
jgi:divalent metal cation (Fe/Co/Zn/Cd) transporter